MIPSWRYRVGALAGSISLVAGATVVANHPAAQSLFVSVPVAGRGMARTLPPGALATAVATVAAVATVTLNPLFKPRPRRVTDTVTLTVRRVLLLALALAAVGYFDYTYRLPRSTLVMTTGQLGVVLPAWFVAIRRRLGARGGTAVIVGDDIRRFPRIRELAEERVIGYVSPVPSPTGPGGKVPRTDGGESVADERRGVAVEPPDATLDLDRLGGLSRLDDTLVDYDPDVTILAFLQPDRQEFFGTLHSCHQHGVTAKIASDNDSVDSVLSRDGADVGGLVTIDLEPWDWQDITVKRAFDVVFAAVGLAALAPVALAVAIGIKAEDGGPVLYSQRRTSWLGATYTIYKFRTMVPDAEAETGPVVSPGDDGEDDSRVTRLGRLLRPTHIDEIPQLWSILVGDMSVVGPRPERPAMDEAMEESAYTWRKRWFVKPGLTGLAQVNEVTGVQPETKLRYDVEYIRWQSLRFDLRIVARQMAHVARDVVALAVESLGQRR